MVQFTFKQVPPAWQETVRASLAGIPTRYPTAASVVVRRLRGECVLRMGDKCYDDALVLLVYDKKNQLLDKLRRPSTELIS